MTQAQFQQQYGRAPSHAALDVPQQAPQESLGQKVSGGFDAVFGGKQIGESLVKAGTNVSNLATGGIQKFNAGLPDNTVDVPALAGDYLKAGSNFIPGAAKGTGLAAKTAIGAGTGYAMDVGSNLKNNQPAPFTPGAGTAIMGALPVVGSLIARPATAIVGRLLKGVGSGLAGVSSKTLSQIIDNPAAAQKADAILKKSGSDALLEKNARTIVNGIGQVRQEARSAFGDALGKLKGEDINPQTFRAAIQPTLDKFGSAIQDGQRTLSNVEFSDPKNIEKASGLIDRLNVLPNGPMDGATLRKLSDDIESSKFKTATSDERLSFNHFADELSGSVKNAINNSTDKLTDMNAKYSKDMQLSETMQNVFGKVKFKNLPEVVKASQQLETLFAKKGLAPKEIDNFLTRIGVHPADFKTSEAVRQISGKEEGANSIGLSPSELSREATSALVSPELVKNLSIASGVAKEKLEPFLQALSSPARNAVVQALLQAQAGSQPQIGQGGPNQ